VISREGVGDDLRIDGWIHRQRVGVDDEDAIVIFAEMLVERVPQDAASRVRAADTNQERVGDRRHGRAQRRDDFRVGIGARVIAPKRHFVEDHGEDRIATDGTETRRMHFDNDAVA